MKTLTIKSLRMPLSLINVLLVLTVSGFATASTQTLSIKVPLNLSEFIPGANQGNGEVVDFTGTLHAVILSTVKGNNIHVNELFNPQGAKGVGETTGDVWAATGETRQDLTSSISAFPFETTFVNNFKLVDGTGGSFLIHENIHVTVLADGTTTAFVDNFTFTCK